MGRFDRSEQAVLVLAGTLMLASFLDWISVETGSATGIDSTYGLVVLLTGLAIAWATVYERVRAESQWLHIFGGILTFGMLFLYYDSLFPQEEPPYLSVHLPDGTVGPTLSMQFEPGILLAAAAGAGLVLVGFGELVGKLVGALGGD